MFSVDPAGVEHGEAVGLLCWRGIAEIVFVVAIRQYEEALWVLVRGAALEVFDKRFGYAADRIRGIEDTFFPATVRSAMKIGRQMRHQLRVGRPFVPKIGDPGDSGLLVDGMTGQMGGIGCRTGPEDVVGFRVVGLEGGSYRKRHPGPLWIGQTPPAIDRA